MLCHALALLEFVCGLMLMYLNTTSISLYILYAPKSFYSNLFRLIYYLRKKSHLQLTLTEIKQKEKT